MLNAEKSIDRRAFLNAAALFEGGLVAVALVLAWIAGLNPVNEIIFEWSAILWGIGGTILLSGSFLLAYLSPVRSLLQIKRFLIEVLGPYLDACRWYDLLALALLAGVGEELLFRGVILPWLESGWGPSAGLMGSSLLFGLSHFITPMYAFLAGVVGLYLGILLDIGEQRNLLTPMFVHAVYDLFAFIVVARAFRAERDTGCKGSSPDDSSF